MAKPVQLARFEIAWAAPLQQADRHTVRFASAAVLEAHMDTCVECHNTDEQARCPLRRALVTAMTQEVRR